MIKVQRALISVSDKTHLKALARTLHRLGVEVLSTGGTARHLQTLGIPVRLIEEETHFPEILDGRVKTLHPMVHAGILARRDNPDHMATLARLGIKPIDLVVVNLYPFEKIIRRQRTTLNEALEHIDIGGPTLLRAAAKNFRFVAVVCDPVQYEDVISELEANNGILSDRVLMRLAREVFERTASYDAAIHDFLAQRGLGQEILSGMPLFFQWRGHKVMDLRYGENPHQAAALYGRREEPTGFLKIKQLNGKPLSCNNILDMDAAYAMANSVSDPCAVIVKHTNPTGIAAAATLDQAYRGAHRCDPLSAFGGIIGLNRICDAATANRILKSGFMECVIAPDYETDALELLRQKKNLRIVALPVEHWREARFDLKCVHGGLLVQETDTLVRDPSSWAVVTRRRPTAAQMKAMVFGWSWIKFLKSNAAALVKGTTTVGIGAGLTSRVDAVCQALRKAGARAKGSVLISDGFFPKTDNIQWAAAAGVRAVIQPGGSIQDAAVIRAADERGLVMVVTRERHFRH